MSAPTQRFYAAGSGFSPYTRCPIAASNRPEAGSPPPNAHPVLISRRLFEQARQQRETQLTSIEQRGHNPRTKNHGKTWNGQRNRFILSGLMKCSLCGFRYHGVTGGSKTLGIFQKPQAISSTMKRCFLNNRIQHVLAMAICNRCLDLLTLIFGLKTPLFLRRIKYTIGGFLSTCQ